MSIFNWLFGKGDSGNGTIKRLSPTDFKNQIENKKAQLIDVRTSNEFKSGHIKGAKNIDYYSPAFIQGCEKLNKEQPVYIYCRSGMRSRQAAKKLSKLGFNEIYDLKGGIASWL